MKAIQAKGYEVSTTAIEMSDFGFTEEELSTARRATITAVTQNAMMLWDGTDPAATLGHPVVANALPIVVESAPSITLIKLIRQGGSNSFVTITLER